MSTKRMTRVEAEQEGFTVDTHCWPWLGYKGPRFAPTERIAVYSDREEELLEVLRDARMVLTMADRSDAWKQERARCLARLDRQVAKVEGLT